ncbi:penicillin-binding protein 2 [Bailinhaonella thermotolerans]|uniref:penicillin-binding protein 2 n=1 Tax=Bailinhaonella thermotolerans TaxID=1070861 RepID=UPI001F5B1069|nr:penicillin-binding protein 2 [Bailinhaonella thermotolerans]
MFGRLWQVQVLDGGRYARAAVEDHVRQITVPAVRGRIVDDRGRPLVRNRTAMVVSVDLIQLGRLPGRGRDVLRRLASALGRPYGEIAGRARLCSPTVGRPCWPGSPYQPVPVADGVEERVALQIVERPEVFPGVTAEARPVREYPGGPLAAHVLGYLAPDDVSGGGDPSGTRLVGRDGLEATYDADLRGTPGRREVVVDSAGQVLRVAREQPPRAGATLVTSIDAKVQEVVEKALAKAVRRAPGASTGAAVVLDARTGRVVAMAGYPSYDPRVWTGGISPADYRRLTSGDRPLVPRAIQGQWPPASTWKITSTVAAVKAGKDPRGGYDCSGSYRVGDRSFRNFGGIGHGTMDLRRALVVSCDTIYYRFAHEMWRKDQKAKNPADPMQKTARAFGFGRRTGVDLPGEAAGRVPDRAWKRAYWESTREAACAEARRGHPELARRDPARARYLTAVAAESCTHGYLWTAGDAANFSIGQGDVLVTPLQLARAYAALANGGTLFGPRVARAVVAADGRVLREITPPAEGRLPVGKKTLKYIRDALAEVPRSGTAAAAFAGFPWERVAVAGKTGTAESFGARDTSWFASYAPAGRPRLVTVVVIGNGGTGADAAAPAVREIWEGIYGLGGREAALPGGVPADDLPRLDAAGAEAPAARGEARAARGETAVKGAGPGKAAPEGDSE